METKGENLVDRTKNALIDKVGNKKGYQGGFVIPDNESENFNSELVTAKKVFMNTNLSGSIESLLSVSFNVMQ